MIKSLMISAFAALATATGPAATPTHFSKINLAEEERPQKIFSIAFVGEVL